MEPDRPLIQIDDLVRPMTDQEIAQLTTDQDVPPPPVGTE